MPTRLPVRPPGRAFPVLRMARLPGLEHYVYGHDKNSHHGPGSVGRDRPLGAGNEIVMSRLIHAEADISVLVLDAVDLPGALDDLGLCSRIVAMSFPLSGACRCEGLRPVAGRLRRGIQGQSLHAREHPVLVAAQAVVEAAGVPVVDGGNPFGPPLGADGIQGPASDRTFAGLEGDDDPSAVEHRENESMEKQLDQKIAEEFEHFLARSVEVVGQ